MADVEKLELCVQYNQCLLLTSSLTTPDFHQRLWGPGGRNSAPQPPNVLAPKALVLVGKGHGGERVDGGWRWKGRIRDHGKGASRI